MRSLTFSSRPGGPRCLKYQNVPKLRSFWANGKPREKFQSWDIRVYFIPVPNDHTVPMVTGKAMQRTWQILFQLWFLTARQASVSTQDTIEGNNIPDNSLVWLLVFVNTRTSLSEVLIIIDSRFILPTIASSWCVTFTDHSNINLFPVKLNQNQIYQQHQIQRSFQSDNDI